MDASRRTFLKTTAAAGGALAAGLAGSRPLAGADPTAATPGDPSKVTRRPPPPRSLKILVLGGTSFIGPIRSSTPCRAATRSPSSTGAAPTRTSSPGSRSWSATGTGT